MPFDAVLTLGLLLAVTIALAAELLSPDALLLGALGVLVLFGVLEPETAFEGFANLTLVAIGSLYAVAAGLRRCGALDKAEQLLFGRKSRGLRSALGRMTPTVATASAFLNNTPVVAMGVPSVRGWARRHDVPASKLLMPLSFASIMGGLCTIIGTSTNLVTDGLLRSHGLRGLGFFELAWVGVPCAIVGILYLVFFAPMLLPERTDPREEEEEVRQRLLELDIEEGSTLVGRTVDELGLTELPGLSLVRIERGDRTVGPVRPVERVSAGDRLMYAGEAAPEDVGEKEETAKLHAPAKREEEETQPELHQAVISESSRLVGETVEEADFVERYNAAVTGVRRGGQRIEPTERMRLRPGDTLMLDAGPGFREAFEVYRDFYIASEPGGEGRRDRLEARAETTRPIWLAVAILVGIVGLAASGVLHIALAALLGAFAMVALGFIAPGEAREAVDWSVLIVIGAALGLASALESSGAAELVGHAILGVAQGFGPVAVLVGVVVATMVLTGLITNNAAAALLFPITLSVASSQGLDPRPLLIGMTIAASLALWTPLGYQTNLMVYGPGNYRFGDFIRFGLPLQLLLAVVAVLTITILWPL